MKWIVDREGDIGFCFWEIIVFWKYKNYVIIQWFPEGKDINPAPKYIR